MGGRRLRRLVSGLLAAWLLIGIIVLVPRSEAGTWTCGASSYSSDPFSEIVQNGGFESDFTNWYIPPPAWLPAISPTVYHTGAKSAWVHSYGTHEGAAQNLASPPPSAYVLSYWFYVGTWGPGGMFAVELLDNWDSSSGAADYTTVLYWVPPNTLGWWVWRPIAGGGASQTYARTLTTGEWHLIETVIDTTAGRQCLFIDGGYVDTLTVDPATTFLPTVLVLGDISWSGDAGDGYWDDVSLQSLGPPLPDYIPTNPQPAGTIRTGESLPTPLSIEVLNRASVSATATSTLAFYDESTPGSPFATFTVPALAGGASAGPFTATWTSPGTPGTYRIVAEVDYGGTVAEANEGNNRYTWTATVYPPPITTLTVGTPSYAGTYVTSATPLTLSALDRSGTGILRTAYRIDSGAWQDYALPFTLAGEGDRLVEWFSEDNLGNVEAVRSATLTVDDTPPTTVLTPGAPSYGSGFVTSATWITLQATDGGVRPCGVDRIEYRIDAGSWSPHVSAFTLSGEGAHTVEFNATDHLGNAEATVSATLTVDDSGPTAAVTPGAPNYTATDTWITSSTPVSVIATDLGVIPVGVDSVEYRVWSGSWIPWSPYATPFTVPPEGRRYVEWRASDHLGNTGAGNVSLVVDDTPPAVSLTFTGPSYSSGGDTWITSGGRIALSAVDGGVFPVGLDALEHRTWLGGWSPWTDYVAPFGLSGEGRQYLEWRASDLLGNTRQGNVSYIVDNTPPTSAFSLSDPFLTDVETYVTSATRVSVTSIDGGVVPAGLQSLECSPDGIAWTPYSVPIVLSGPDGPRSVYCRGTDRLGNVESAKLLSVVLDNTPPATTITIPAGPLSVDSQFALSAVDAGSGVEGIEYRVDGGTWQPYEGAFALPIGEHVIGYRSADRLGNQEPERTVTVRVENWKPIIAFLFTLILLLLAVPLAWHRRRTEGSRWKWILLGGIVFAIAEAVTGILSALLGILPVPPFLDLGTIVDVALLAAGLILTLILYLRAQPRPAPPPSAPPPPEGAA